MKIDKTNPAYLGYILLKNMKIKNITQISIVDAYAVISEKIAPNNRQFMRCLIFLYSTEIIALKKDLISINK